MAMMKFPHAFGLSIDPRAVHHPLPSISDLSSSRLTGYVLDA